MAARPSSRQREPWTGISKDTCTHDEFVVLGAELQAVLELGSGSAKPHT